MRSKHSFNEIAELYDEVRPSYPDVLIDWVIEKSKVIPGDELLEIAPGTGQATRKFVERGFPIHAVELGDKLAALLEKNMVGKNVTVYVSPFEEWKPLNKKRYKLAYCATAWHWLDPDVKYEKVYSLLEEDGYLALIWNNSIGSAKNEILDEAYELLFKYNNDKEIHTTKPKSSKEVKEQKHQSVETIEESGHFDVDDYLAYEWSFRQPKENLIKGFYTQSSFVSLPKDIKEGLKLKLEPVFEKLEDEIETYFRSTVYLCKKRS